MFESVTPPDSVAAAEAEAAQGKAVDRIVAMKEADLILSMLTLIDLTLVGSLIVMVMFSGYENFVSQIDIRDGGEKLRERTAV